MRHYISCYRRWVQLSCTMGEEEDFNWKVESPLTGSRMLLIINPMCSSKINHDCFDCKLSRFFVAVTFLPQMCAQK